MLCLLSHSEKQIHMNKKNHNVLDSTINAERKNVAFAIASHNRSGRNKEITNLRFELLLRIFRALQTSRVYP